MISTSGTMDSWSVLIIRGIGGPSLTTKNNYCAGMTSTQRSESANNMLKHHVPRNSSMNKFVQNYNNLLTSRYKVEQEAEHETKQVLQTNSLLFFKLCLQNNVHMPYVVSFLIQ